MAKTDDDKIIVDGYLELLEKLSPDNKLDLISRLSASLRTDLEEKDSLFKKSFGAFVSEETAEEIIKEIRASRLSTMEIEPF